MLKIKNWSKFQHYKDRNPPWIKLHCDIFTSEDWVMLADASKLLAVACMVIASKNNGCVPNDPHYIKRVAYLEELPNLKPLIDCGFLENMLADASDCKQDIADARPETYRTDLKRKKKEPKGSKEKKPKFDPEQFALPEWLEPYCKEWEGWLEVRKAKRAPPTEQALFEAVAELQRLNQQGHFPDQVLNQSILRGYTGLFPIKPVTNGVNLNGKPTKEDRAKAAIMRGLASFEASLKPS